ncbi:hypothetical protein Q9292_06375, partial [Methylophilus sp. VKM B-3414]|uniref:hypothetical protein n=1 Tax=Methylophilus sp. VKM B-3414 TaxID=3076121 RepID=UPI0028C8A714
MGVTPIYHFDYTKIPFKFKVTDGAMAGSGGFCLTSTACSSPNGSMTYACVFFKMCVKEGEATDQQP